MNWPITALQIKQGKKNCKFNQTRETYHFDTWFCASIKLVKWSVPWNESQCIIRFKSYCQKLLLRIDITTKEDLPSLAILFSSLGPFHLKGEDGIINFLLQQLHEPQTTFDWVSMKSQTNNRAITTASHNKIEHHKEQMVTAKWKNYIQMYKTDLQCRKVLVTKFTITNPYYTTLTQHNKQTRQWIGLGIFN